MSNSLKVEPAVNKILLVCVMLNKLFKIENNKL